MRQQDNQEKERLVCTHNNRKRSHIENRLYRHPWHRPWEQENRICGSAIRWRSKVLWQGDSTNKRTLFLSEEATEPKNHTKDKRQGEATSQRPTTQNQQGNREPSNQNQFINRAWRPNEHTQRRKEKEKQSKLQRQEVQQKSQLDAIQQTIPIHRI